jgi:UDP-N-acetyl-D-mannosaminuronate dehydrogenase
MPDYVAQRAAMALNRDAKAVNGSRILVLGLAYERNSGDVRVSPVPVFCDRMAALGRTYTPSIPTWREISSRRVRYPQNWLRQSYELQTS